MKKKIIVITALLGLLAYTVFKMMKFEESIRRDHIITHFVEDETKPLIQNLNDNELLDIVNDIEINFRSGDKYFQQKQSRTQNWKNIFLKGVNLGVAVPGKFPAEFSLTFEQYLEWFMMIGNMNSNVIRVYTILPPDFYKALSYYNLQHQNKPLYIMHGVWAKVPKHEDYFEETYTHEFQKEIMDVINVVHGKANLKKVIGKANGVYTTDVSDYIIAYLLGREWEPKGVFKTIKEHRENHYNGTFISLPQGNPMEVWLAKMMDFTVRYETQTYEQQHPISFVNWLPLDPMYHSTEYIENKKVREYDNDLLQVDFKKYNPTSLFKAGVYAAYHVYPYYPDFIYLKPEYAKTINRNGMKDNFLGYLNDLKKHTPGMPLVIAEYGLPTSRGVSHFTPLGYNQGGHSEKQQAKLSLTLTEDILDSGCAGALYFEWADEWFKHNWLVMDFEEPFYNRKIWHNMENPEQNFGIISLESRSKTIDGNMVDWENDQEIAEQNGQKVYAYADPTYFYIATKLSNFDFEKNNLYIAIDTYDQEKGDKKLPFSEKIFDNGFEFLCSFKSTKQAKVQVDDTYSVFTDIYNDKIPIYASKPNSNGVYVDELMLVNRGRKSLIGEKTDSIVNNRSPLLYGKSDKPAYSNADWYWNKENNIFELRLDWHLINVSDPSHKYVLDDKEGTRAIEVTKTDGIRFYIFITDKKNNILQSLPEGEPAFYTWDNWEKPTYTQRKKLIYTTLKQYFNKVKPVESPNNLNTTKEKFEIANFLNNKKGAVSFSFNDAGFTQYQYAFPLINKYKLNATFSILPKQMNSMASIKSLENGEKYKLMGFVQAKELMAKGNELAIQTNTLQTIPLFIPQLNRKVSVVHYVGNKKAILSKEVFVKNKLLPEAIYKQYQYNKVSYNLINTSINNKKMDSILHVSKNKWNILSYYQLYKDSTELHNVNKEFIQKKHIHFDTFREQIRLARNTNYWLDIESAVYKYLYEKSNSKIDVREIGNQIFVTITNKLNPVIFNQALSVNFHTKAKLLKITGAATEGYFSNKTGFVTFNTIPNQVVKIEIIE